MLEEKSKLLEEKIEKFINIYQTTITKNFKVSSAQKFSIINAINDTTKNIARESLIRYVDEVYTWIPLNPNKPEIREAIQDSMLLIDEQNEETKRLPTEFGYKNLYNAITLETKIKTIYIHGNRGTGKTFCINYFLSKYHQDLCKEGFTWFRVDVSKMWDIKEKKNKLYTVAQYLLAHMYYVIFEYARKDTVLNSFMSDVDGLDNSPYINYLKNIYQEEPAAYTECLSIWTKALTQFKNLNLKPNEKKSLVYAEKLIDNIVISLDEKSIKRLIETITDFLETKHHNVIFLIDGIDNIKYRKEEKNFQAFLEDIQYKLNDILTRYKLVYSLRPDSFKMSSIALGHELDENSRTFTIEQPDPKLLLIHKLTLLSNQNTYFQSCREKAYETKLASATPQINRFIEISNELIREINIEDEILTNYGGNLRSFLRNHIRACNYRARYEALKQSRVLSDTEKLQIYREGSMLAGHNYMYDHDTEAVKGKWLPNIFSIGSNDKDQWAGMITLRILQLIRDFFGFFNSNQLFEVLHTLYGYNQQIFNEALNVCYDFRLIEIHAIDTIDDGQIVHRYKIGSKGKRMLNLIAGDELTLSALYFMAQKTKFYFGPNLESDIQVVKNFPELLHNAHDPNERKFQEAVVLSSSLILRHIFISGSNERNAIKKEKWEILRDKNFDTKLIKRSLRIPANILKREKTKTLRKILWSIVLIDENRLTALENAFKKLHDSLET